MYGYGKIGVYLSLIEMDVIKPIDVCERREMGTVNILLAPKGHVINCRVYVPRERAWALVWDYYEKRIFAIYRDCTRTWPPILRAIKNENDTFSLTTPEFVTLIFANKLSRCAMRRCI